MRPGSSGDRTLQQQMPQQRQQVGPERQSPPPAAPAWEGRFRYLARGKTVTARIVDFLTLQGTGGDSVVTLGAHLAVSIGRIRAAARDSSKLTLLAVVDSTEMVVLAIPHPAYVGGGGRGGPPGAGASRSKAKVGQ